MKTECKCGHDLGQHVPHPDKPFAWPCVVCDCEEYDEVEYDNEPPE